jgi:segregation and condensation protein B
MRQFHSETPRLLGSVALRFRGPASWGSGGGPALSVQNPAAARGGLPSTAESSGEAGRSRTREMTLARLEAVLFLAREPLSSRRLAQYANLADGTQARTLVRRLNELYDAAGRAFRVEQVAGGFQLLTRRKFAPWLRRLAHVPGETRLSAPALETLAVIAYRQPVARADIEAIRGVNCGEILRQLMERDLVRISGRGEELGRPYLYSTTKRFLEIFGLVQLDELPRADALRSLPLPASPPPLEALVIAEESSPDQYDVQSDDLDYDTADDTNNAEDADEPESLEE